MIFDRVTCYKLHILEYGGDMGSCGIKKEGENEDSKYKDVIDYTKDKDYTLMYDSEYNYNKEEEDKNTYN